MSQRPLKFISREKESELINKLLTIVDNRDIHPHHTALIMASPDYSATVAMHLSHAWSVRGEIIPIIPVDVTYPDEKPDYYEMKMEHQLMWLRDRTVMPRNIVMVEAGIIRGGNWAWMLEVLYKFGYTRDDITLVTLLENVHSRVKSDYVGEYYDDEKEDLVFYYERFNKHWPVR
jgi:hypothetical protein